LNPRPTHYECVPVDVENLVNTGFPYTLLEVWRLLPTTIHIVRPSFTAPLPTVCQLKVRSVVQFGKKVDQAPEDDSCTSQGGRTCSSVSSVPRLEVRKSNNWLTSRPLGVPGHQVGDT